MKTNPPNSSPENELSELSLKQSVSPDRETPAKSVRRGGSRPGLGQEHSPFGVDQMRSPFERMLNSADKATSLLRGGGLFGADEEDAKANSFVGVEGSLFDAEDEIKVNSSLGFFRSSIERSDGARAKFKVEFKRGRPRSPAAVISAAVPLDAIDTSEIGLEFDEMSIHLEDGNGNAMSRSSDDGKLMELAFAAVGGCGGDSQRLVEILNEELQTVFPASGVSKKAAQSSAEEVEQVAKKSTNLIEQEIEGVGQFISELRSLKRLSDSSGFGSKGKDILDQECLYRASKLLNGIAYAVRENLKKSKQVGEEKGSGKESYLASSAAAGIGFSEVLGEVLKSFRHSRVKDKELIIRCGERALIYSQENSDEISMAINESLSEKIERLSNVLNSGRLMGVVFKEILVEPQKVKGAKTKPKLWAYGFKREDLASVINGKASASEGREQVELDEDDFEQIIASAIRVNLKTLEDHNLELGKISAAVNEGNAAKLTELLESNSTRNNSIFFSLSNVVKLRGVLGKVNASSKAREERHDVDAAVFGSEAEAVNSYSDEASSDSGLFGRNDVFGKQIKMRAIKYLVNYPELRLNFYVENHSRVPTYYGNHQKDHVTAYTILLQSMLSLFPSFYRGRGLTEYLEKEFEAVLNPSEAPNQKKGRESGLHEVYDLRGEIEKLSGAASFSSSSAVSDQTAALRLCDGIALRCVADQVCGISENFLREINSQKGGSFDQGGRSNREQEAAATIAKISGLYSLVKQENILCEFLNSVADKGLEGNPEFEKFQRFLTRVREKISDILKDEKASEASDANGIRYNCGSGISVVASSLTGDSRHRIEITNGNEFVKGLAKAISDSIDLRYGYLRKWSYAQWKIESDDGSASEHGLEEVARQKEFDDYFYGWTNKLVARHLRIAGLILRSLPNEIKQGEGFVDEVVGEFLQNILEKKEGDVLSEQKIKHQEVLAKLEKELSDVGDEIAMYQDRLAPTKLSRKKQEIELSLREEILSVDFFELEDRRTDKVGANSFKSSFPEESFADLSSRAKRAFIGMLRGQSLGEYLESDLQEKYPNIAPSLGRPSSSSVPVGTKKIVAGGKAGDLEIDI